MKRLIKLLIILFSLINPYMIIADETYTITASFVDSSGVSIKEDEIEVFEKDEEVSWFIDDIDDTKWNIEYDPILSLTRKDNGYLVEATKIESNLTITFILKDKGEYRINRYFQNIDNDSYTLETIINTGAYNSIIPTEEDLIKIEGFTIVDYNTSEISFNGENEVDIYYDRNSYIVTIDTNKDEEEKTVIVRYDDDLCFLINPFKPGYKFVGWCLDESLNEVIDVSNYHVKNDVKIYAKYVESLEQSSVRVIYWLENADDENYSYLTSKNYKANIGDTFKIDNDISLIDLHTHGLYCYGVSSFNPVEVDDYVIEHLKRLKNGIEDGYIYLFNDKGSEGEGKQYLLRYEDNWYLSSEDNVSDKYIDSTIGLEGIGYAFDSFYKFEAIKTCDSLYIYKYSDEITVSGNNDIVNVYLDREEFTFKFGDSRRWPNDKYGTIKAKWGQNIYNEYLAICKKAFGQSAISGSFSIANGANNIYVRVLVTMGTSNTDFYKNGYPGNKTLHYWLMNDDLSTYDNKYNSYWNNRNSTSIEDYIEIEGYTINYDKSTPVGEKIDNGGNIYYDRKEYNIEIYDGNKLVDTYSAYYGQSLDFLKTYNPNNSDLHKSFIGFKNNIKDETLVDLNNLKMPSSNLTLYITYSTIDHKVEIYTDDTYTSYLTDPIYVKHSDSISELPIIDSSNFIGYFYNDNGKQRQYLLHTAVIKDLKLYPKFINDSYKTYKVNFKLDDSDVAKPFIGSANINETIEISAKTLQELYPEYRDIVYPCIDKLSFKVKDNTEQTINYKYVDVSYRVKYIDSFTNTSLIEDKVVEHYGKNNVTENFIDIENFIIEDYHIKTMMLKDGVENEIVFKYHFDPNKATVVINEYIVSKDQSIIPLDNQIVKIVDKNSEFTYELKNYELNKKKTIESNNYEIVCSDKKITKNIKDENVIINIYYYEKLDTSKINIKVNGLENNDSIILKIIDTESNEETYISIDDNKDILFENNKKYLIEEVNWSKDYYHTRSLEVSFDSDDKITINKRKFNVRSYNYETHIINRFGDSP